MKKSRSGFFRAFASHTQLKLFLLRSYMERWARILLKSGHTRVWFIDAFAGRGRDDEGREGSPLIACRIAAEIADYFRGRSPRREVAIVAIEADRATARALRKNLEEIPADPCNIETIEGTLEDYVDVLLARAAGDPILVFLDPFGVKGLSAATLAKILSAPRSELLVLFSTSGAGRLHGAATAPKPKARPQLAMPSLFGDLDAQDEQDDPDPGDVEPDSSTLGWERTAPASEEILNTAFGDVDWRSPIVAAKPSERPRKWLELYKEVLRRAGAKYVVSFSVEDERDRHQYYLVHASKNSTAVRAMKDAIREATKQREREFGRGTPLFYVTTVALDELVARVRARFQGQTVNWTDRNEPADTVQGFAIRETDALYSDMQDLREALTALGYRLPGRKIVFRFP